MYYIKRSIHFDEPIVVPTNMYEIKPICSFVDYPIDIVDLAQLQDDIIAKIEVLNHNLAVIAKKAGIVQHKEINLAELDKLQESILSRLHIILKKIQDIASEANITINLKPCDFVQTVKTDFEQNNILSASDKRLRNISIFANANKPPISILLFLRLLKNQGRRVACRSYSYPSLQSHVVKTISEYVDAHLNLDEPQYSYEVIVSIIWNQTNTDVDELICYDNVFSEVPIFGEMITLLYLCIVLSIDSTVILKKLETLNEDLLYKRSVKSGLALLNKSAANITEAGSSTDLCFSAFATSCLVHANAFALVNQMLGANVNVLLDRCYARQLVDFIISSK